MSDNKTISDLPSPLSHLYPSDYVTPADTDSSYLTSQQLSFSTLPTHNVLYRSVQLPMHDAVTLTSHGNEVYRSVHDNATEIPYESFAQFDFQHPSSKELTLNPKYDYSGHVTSRPSPPLAPGGYLEPNCHFYVENEDADVILSTLLTILTVYGVDCDLHSDRFKMNCEAYHGCAKIEFAIRIFSALSPTSFAIEFQRRIGDCVPFYNLYKSVRDQFLGHSTEINSRHNVRLSCPPLDLPDFECSKEVSVDGLSCLISMSKSDYVDVKGNALAALAEMSANSAMQPVMIELGCVQIFVQSIVCDFADVHRCALTGLANLLCSDCDRSLYCDVLSDSDIKKAFCALIHSRCPMIVREVGRALAALVKTMRDEMANDATINSCVKSLALHNDIQAREYAENILLDGSWHQV